METTVTVVYAVLPPLQILNFVGKFHLSFYHFGPLASIKQYNHEFLRNILHRRVSQLVFNTHLIDFYIFLDSCS